MSSQFPNFSPQKSPAADQQGQSTPFIEFLHSALLQALREAASTGPNQSTPQVPGNGQFDGDGVHEPESGESRIQELKIKNGELRSDTACGPVDKALVAGLVGRTLPDKPNSSLQKYRRTIT